MKNEDLIKLAKDAANGKNIIDTSLQSQGDLINALNIISKVKKSFSHSDEIFTQPEQIKEGDIWGHLKIIKKIGAGGMGMVYEAYDSVLDRNVAVKFLNPTASEYISSKNFIEEARRIAKVRHPNVMAIFGANTFENITGFWSELLDGKDLSTFNLNQLSWDKNLKIANDLARAVKAIHDNDIIHGDIKPQNIIIDKGKRAVLMDFGSGKNLSQDSNQLSSSTPIIMAPELFKGDTKSKASDVYSLGIVFYYLSTNGNYPYTATSLDDLQKQLFLRKPKDFSKTQGSKAWHKLIKTMTCYDPKDSPTINKVISKLSAIELAPIKRKKKIVVSSILTMLFITIGVLFYSNNSLTTANNETLEVNNLMFDLLASTDAGKKGKDVLMIDTLEKMVEETKQSDNISVEIKAKTLYQLSLSISSLGFKAEAIKLLEYIAVLPNVSSYHKANTLIERAFLTFQAEHTVKSVDKALSYLSQASSIYPVINQSMDDVVAKYNLTMSFIQQDLNNNDVALKLINKNIEFWNSRKLSKPIINQIIGSYTRLGDIYGKKNLFSAAIDYYSEGIDFYNKHHSTNIRTLFVLKNNLASVYRQVGKYEKAITLLQETTQVSKTYLGEESNDYISSSVNLASAYLSLGNVDKSIVINDEIAKIIIRKNGGKSIQYLIFNNNRTIILQNAKQYQQAEIHYRENIRIAKSLLGKNHNFTFLSQGNLSELLYLSGQPQKSIDLVKEVLPSAIKELGENDINVQLLKESLAWSYHLLGNDELALPIIKEVIKSLTQTFDENHELTQHAINFLKRIQKSKIIE